LPKLKGTKFLVEPLKEGLAGVGEEAEAVE